MSCVSTSVLENGVVIATVRWKNKILITAATCGDCLSALKNHLPAEDEREHFYIVTRVYNAERPMQNSVVTLVFTDAFHYFRSLRCTNFDVIADNVLLIVPGAHGRVTHSSTANTCGKLAESSISNVVATQTMRVIAAWYAVQAPKLIDKLGASVLLHPKYSHNATRYLYHTIESVD